MSDDYTPTTDEVRTAHRVALRGIVDPEAADAAFDRTIESVRAEERERIERSVEAFIRHGEAVPSDVTTYNRQDVHNDLRNMVSDLAREGA